MRHAARLRRQAARHRRAGPGHAARSPCASTRRWSRCTHPLASVRESYNAVFVEGDAVGSLMFYGRGAGGMPTASAVLGDVIDAAVNLRQGHPRLARHVRPGAHPRRSTRPRAEYLLSLEVADRPGVLHAVTGVFARHDVSIRAAEQEGLGADARLVFITHEAQEAAVQATRARAARPRRGAPGRRPAARHRRLSVMRYVSTRGSAPELGFADVLLAGLATDGGLYVPGGVAVAAATSTRRRDYARRAAAVMAPVRRRRRSAAPTVLRRRCARRPTRRSATPPSCPLVQIGDRRVAARAVPRADAGVQGRRPAARRAAVRPRARRARASGSRSSGRPAATPARRRSTRVKDCAQRRHRHPLPARAGSARCSAGR